VRVGVDEKVDDMCKTM